MNGTPIDMNESVREAEKLLEEQARIVEEFHENIVRHLRDLKLVPLDYRETQIMLAIGAYIAKMTTTVLMQTAARINEIEAGDARPVLLRAPVLGTCPSPCGEFLDFRALAATGKNGVCRCPKCGQRFEVR